MSAELPDAHTHIYTHTHTHARTHAHTDTHTHTDTHYCTTYTDTLLPNIPGQKQSTSLLTDLPKCTHTRTPTHTHTCTHIQWHRHIHTHAHTHIHTHTHTYTYTPAYCPTSRAASWQEIQRACCACSCEHRPAPRHPTITPGQKWTVAKRVIRQMPFLCFVRYAST